MEFQRPDIEQHTNRRGKIISFPKSDSITSEDNKLKDHASGNREMIVMAITSGKGGVGKSVITANLGLTLQQLGRNVLLLDADLGLANLDLILGVSARYTIKDFLQGTQSMADVVVEGPNGIRLLPACAGDQSMADLISADRYSLFSGIDHFSLPFDTVLIDTGAGIGTNAVSFAAAAKRVVIVVSPDPTSIADAYAMIKILNVRYGISRFDVIVNLAHGPSDAEKVFVRLLDLVQRFLVASLNPIGILYRDEVVERSVRACQPLMTRFPNSQWALTMRGIGQRLLQRESSSEQWGGPQLFWRQLLETKNVVLPPMDDYANDQWEQ